MVIEIQSTTEFVSTVYENLIKNISKYRDLVGRHLTLSEKILAGHFENFKVDIFTSVIDRTDSSTHYIF